MLFHWYRIANHVDSIPAQIRGRPTELSGHFELDAIGDAKAKSMFRFTVREIDHIVQCMDLPPLFTTDNRITVTSRFGLAVLLRRLAYPARLDDLADEFHRGRSTLSRIISTVGLHILNQYHDLLFLHPSIDRAAIIRYSSAVTQAWPPIEQVYGFIDGSKHYHCRPTWGQQSLYSGHKKQHCYSWQGVVFPDGIIGSIFGPHPGHDNDAGMLRASELLQRLASVDYIGGKQYVIYGDQGYYNRTQLVVPFHDPLTDEEKVFNTCMSALRISVEHCFKLINSNWAFITFKPNQKALLSPTGAYYALAVLFTNIHTCIAGSNQISDFFGLNPITVEDYLNP